MVHWVHDYETLSNCFVGVFEHFKEDIRKVFVVHESRNDMPALIEFLEQNRKQGEWHVSFNGLAFDSQITQHILINKVWFLAATGEQAAQAIYQKAQEIIQRQNQNQFSQYSERDLFIKQVDVFKLNHWDNPAKRSSLKWIQYSMDWENIQDMPIHHSTWITTEVQVNTIVGYCINDVHSTKQIMKLSTKQINLRGALTKDYNIPLYSASEPRISKELFLHFLSQQTGMNKWDIRQLRTRRSVINIGDIILPFVKFKTPEFKGLLEKFQELKLDASNTKGGFKYSVKYKGIRTDFGLGGVHGCRDSGVYKAENGMIIMTSDVVSFYPNLAIRNRWSPAHLPKKEFCGLYEWFFEERKKIPKTDIRNYVYKIILNSTYGLSNDPNCFLYDPEFTMRITINGQLTLMMLYEMLAEAIPGAVPLMQNTDGLEMMIPIEYKDKYMEICAQWETITSLQLEHDEYSKIILADVNNYIAVYQGTDKTKCKGRFEFADLALHKNKSFLIVPKALFHYFVHDTVPEQYLMENRNVFDYCAGVKSKGEWKFQQTCIKDGAVTYEDLQHTLRYFISDTGCKIIKRNTVDGREIQLDSGKWMQKIFTKYEKLDWEDYKIDDKFYLEKIYREIANIVPAPKQQLTLF